MSLKVAFPQDFVYFSFKVCYSILELYFGYFNYMNLDEHVMRRTSCCFTAHLVRVRHFFKY